MSEKIVLTVVYENNPYKAGLKTNWGFACVIEGMEHTILFDTGGDSPTLLANMDKMGIDPKSIDLLVLSHEHNDHVGGRGGLRAEHCRCLQPWKRNPCGGLQYAGACR